MKTPTQQLPPFPTVLLLGLSYLMTLSTFLHSCAGLGAEPVPQASERTPVDVPKVSQENAGVPRLSILQMDILLKADFQSNGVSTVVKALVENISTQSVEKAEFWLCSGNGNAESPRALLQHVYLLENGGRKDLQVNIRDSDDKERSGDNWVYYQIRLPEALQPGHKYWLAFDYVMLGKPDYSTAPILQASEGLREIYLRGIDYVWCPKPYFTLNKAILFDQAKYDPPEHRPSWTLTIESPVGYMAITDGTRVSREESQGIVKDAWKSLEPGMPKLFVGRYKVASRTEGGLTVELYTAEEKRLNKAIKKMEKYAHFYRLYADLFGDPREPTYRIVGSDVVPVGSMFRSGQIVEAYRLEDSLLIAHEMAHVWWGGAFQAKGPGYKFLTEAMAEFSARWLLRVTGEQVDPPDSPSELPSSLSDDWIRIFKYLWFCFYFPVPDSSSSHGFHNPLALVDGSNPRDVQGENYIRGPLVVNHLRVVLGDDVFFKCLRVFLQENRGKQAGIDEFTKTINSVSGKDLTSELKGLLWTTGFASYRVAGFVSEKADGAYRTKVRIRNEGDFGVTCPLMLKTVGGDQKAFFVVEAKQEKQFVYTTSYPVLDVLIDPDGTTPTQYHPEQKVRLWMKLKMWNGNEYAGKAYMYYALGDSSRAVETMSSYLQDKMWRQKTLDVGEFLKKNPSEAPFVFMRGIFCLASRHEKEANEDIRGAFPFMLRALSEGDKVSVPGVYYEVGAIPRQEVGEYLALLRTIAGREFAFPSGLDEPSKKKLVQQWVEWWETTGQQQKLDLEKLKEQFGGQRRAFCERNAAMKQRAWGTHE